MSLTSKVNTGANLTDATGKALSAGANTGADTASAIAQINAAAEAMNEINLATTYAQLKEAGPKNMKSLTQG